MKSTLLRILLILLVGLTATLCTLIPTFETETSIAPQVLLGGYTLLILASVPVKNVALALLLLGCALAIPATEFIWACSRLGWDEYKVMTVTADNELSFTFIGLPSYIITFLIAPLMAFFIGQAIRNHRKIA